MHCHHCTHPLSDNAKFCKQCGTPTQAVAGTEEVAVTKEACSACGALCSPGAKFCLQCGVARTAAAVVTPTPASTPSAPLVSPPVPVTPAADPVAPTPLVTGPAVNPSKPAALQPKLLALVVVGVLAVAAGGTWMMFKPGAQTVINAERLNDPTPSLPEDEDKARAANIVGPQAEALDPAPAADALPPPAEPAVVAAPQPLEPAVAPTPAPVAATPKPAAPKPVAPKPAPKPANTLDSLLD